MAFPPGLISSGSEIIRSLGLFVSGDLLGLSMRNWLSLILPPFVGLIVFLTLRPVKPEWRMGESFADWSMRIDARAGRGVWAWPCSGATVAVAGVALRLSTSSTAQDPSVLEIAIYTLQPLSGAAAGFLLDSLVLDWTESTSVALYLCGSFGIAAAMTLGFFVADTFTASNGFRGVLVGAVELFLPIIVPMILASIPDWFK